MPITGEKEEVKKTKVHHMIRPISKMGQDNAERGWRSIPTLDAEVSVWIENGYKFQWVQYLGEADAFYQLLYILVLEE